MPLLFVSQCDFTGQGENNNGAIDSFMHSTDGQGENNNGGDSFIHMLHVAVGREMKQVLPNPRRPYIHVGPCGYR